MRLSLWFYIIVAVCLVNTLASSCGGSSIAAETLSPGLNLPLPHDAVATPVGRWISEATNHQLTLDGSQYYDSKAATTTGTTTTLIGASESFAYALYRLSLAGIDAENIDIQVQLNESTSGGNSECWVGIADYGNNKWEWQPWSELMSSSLIPTGQYHSCSGNIYIAIAAPSGSSVTVNSLTTNITGLGVGPDKAYNTIEDAYTAASDGDTILIFPQADNAPYSQPALQVYKNNVTFAGVPVNDGSRVKLDGSGYNYTGAGSTPRAMFQFNPGADGCTVQGLEMFDAHNDTQNGAGVRINQANNITVRLCEIHNCDMGMMSNGYAADGTGVNQLVERCVVHDNGNFDHGGYNHNFYMDGHSFTLRASHVYGSLTGHNVKSRAHLNTIEYCYIHGSANRELDLVDDGDNTASANSHSVVKGCVIAKAETMDGNKHTIHFGQDIGGDHNGTLYLVNNTILTPYISAVVQLSAANASCEMYNNLIWDYGTDQTGQQLVYVSGTATGVPISGSHNWLPYGMEITAGHGMDSATTWIQAAGAAPPFYGWDATTPLERDYRLDAFDASICDAGLPYTSLPTPPGSVALSLTPEYQYKLPFCLESRPSDSTPDLGAYEYGP